MTRAVALRLAATLVALTGCSSSDDADDGGGTEGSSGSGDTTGTPSTDPTLPPTTGPDPDTTSGPNPSTDTGDGSTGDGSTGDGSTGVAAAPEIEVTIETRAVADGDTFAFAGATDVGATSTATTVTIDNVGDADLSIAGVTLDASGAASFVLDDGGLDAVVAPGASTSVTVAFAPNNGGRKQAQLTIDNDDADEGAFAVTLLARTTPNTYRVLAPATAPAARFNAALAATDDGRIALFGGRTADGVRQSDTWVFDIEAETWTELSPAAAPSARDAHAMAYLGGGTVVLFGGTETSGPGSNVTPLDDTWILDLTAQSWTELGPAISPPARFQHGMAPAADGVAFLFGGRVDFGGELSDTWTFDAVAQAWTESVVVTSPGPRSAFATAAAPGGDILVVGGTPNGSDVTDEVWAYDPMLDDWSAAASLPEDRFSSMAAAVGDVFVTFAGKTNCCSNPVAGTWAYDPGLDAWTDLAPATEPAPRFAGAMVGVGGDKAILFGGLLLNADPSSAVADTIEYVGP